MAKKVPSTRKTALGLTVKRHPDGTTGPITLGLTYIDGGLAVVRPPELDVGPGLAAKVAVAEAILQMAAFDLQVIPLLMGDPQHAARVELAENAISFTWPEPGSYEGPVKFTVRDGEEGATYDTLGLSGAEYLDETLDVFGKGTVLLHETDVTAPIVLETEVATHSVREALQLALFRLFNLEPNDLRTGHRTVLACYYDLPFRITLADRPFATPTPPEDARTLRYQLLTFLTVEVAGVRLVSSPGVFDTMPRTIDRLT